MLLPATAEAARPARSDISAHHELPFSQQLDRLLDGDLTAAVHFQPIVDLCEGLVTGYEALARFPRELGTRPDVCFEQARQLGRRAELEQLMCRQALSGRKLLPANCFLTVNVGPEFLVSPQWHDVLRDVSDLAGVVIEITEETSITDYESVRVRLAQIRALGGSIAVDDAGAGYASLHHILEMKPDFIKLDRHFVQNCHAERAKSTLIEMMGSAANRLDAWIIAEGVETVSELGELIRLGVPLAQGYLLARPHADMQDVTPEVRSDIRQRNESSGEGSYLRKHVDPCLCCSSATEAEMHLAQHGETHLAVVTDQWGRPVRVLERHTLAGLRWIDSFMRIQLNSDPADVLKRAFTRDAACRFDPIAVINPEGECQGVLSIDRLACSLLGAQIPSRRSNVH